MFVSRLFSFAAAAPAAETDILVKHTTEDSVISILNNLNVDIDGPLVENGSHPLSWSGLY
jgi:hypothetical protein